MAEAPKIVGPGDGESIELGGMGVRFMVDGEESGGGFSLVEHPIAPRALCAPMHRHANEDEYSYVLEGRMGAKLGDEVVLADPGDLVFKPRKQWHTFWNPGDEPARVLEIISPAGFENYFRELAKMLEAGASLDAEETAEFMAGYGFEVQPESVQGLCEEHGLHFGVA
jgi:mannose-6-phosphate isomerase-like protein (cupin superfamily)